MNHQISALIYELCSLTCTFELFYLDLHFLTVQLKLKDIATAQNINGLPSSLACISNFSEICSALLTTQVKETLASTHELIEVIHVTDQVDFFILLSAVYMKMYHYYSKLMA